MPGVARILMSLGTLFSLGTLLSLCTLERLCPQKVRAVNRRNDTSAIKRALNAGEWCHAPHKDVVVPPYGDVQFSSSTSPEEIERAIQLPFEHTLLHVGGIWGAGNHGTRKVTFYSQGMRQAL